MLEPLTRRAPARHRGFTLIELMVVLAISAVLASLAAPQFSQTLARWQLQSAAHHLAAELNQARYDAARAGRPLEVHVTAGTPWCWSVSAVAGCACESAQACQLRRSASTSWPLVSVDESRTFSFAPTADARATPAHVALSNSHDERLRVVLTPMGRARVCSPDRATAGTPLC